MGGFWIHRLAVKARTLIEGHFRHFAEIIIPL